MANEVVGERKLLLGGTEYVLRPSWEAIQSIETQCGPLWDASQKIVAGSIVTAAFVVHAFYTDGGTHGDPKRKKANQTFFGRLIVKDGLGPTRRVILPMLMDLIKAAGVEGAGEGDDSKSADDPVGDDSEGGSGGSELVA